MTGALPGQPSLMPLNVFGGWGHCPGVLFVFTLATTVPTAAFSATEKLNAPPVAMVCVVVAVASNVPVPPVPWKISKAKLSLPAGAPNVSVHVRPPPVVVVQRLDDE